MSKNGTTSTDLFFKKLGYKSAHWLGSFIDSNSFDGLSFEDVLKCGEFVENDFDALTDVPWCFAYEYFDKKYANAKFILMTRPLDDWLISLKISLITNKENSLRHISWSKAAGRDIKDLKLLTDKELIEIYTNHTKNVIEYFKDSKNFLYLDLYDENKEIKIGNFLNKDVTGLTFTKEYVTKDTYPNYLYTY